MKRLRRRWIAIRSSSRDERGARHAEAGDTLLEVLFTLMVLGICSVALITAFSTSISASAEERNLVTISTVMGSASESVFAQFQQASSPFDTSCPANYASVVSSISPPPPSGYQVSISSVQYLDSGGFISSCNAGSTAPQLITVNVAGPSGSGGSDSVVVQDVNSTPPVAGPVAQLVVISAPVAGSASSATNLGPIVVQEQDAFGIPTTTAESITLSSGSSGGMFSNSLGGSPVTTLSIPSGSSTATFYYGDTKAGTPTITAAVSGLTSAIQQEVINQGPPTQLVFTSTKVSGSASASANLGQITVQEEDSFGNPTSTAETVTLSSSSPGTSEFSSTLGGSALTTVSIPSGLSTATFYYGDTKAGTPTINAAATGLTSATQQEAILPTISSPNASVPYSVNHGQPAIFIITGTGFTGNATVSFSGGGFTNFIVTFVNSTQLNVTASGGSSSKGTYNLIVTDPGIGSVTSTGVIKVK
jgi:type II secretory pathway pseudopilin PulG